MARRRRDQASVRRVLSLSVDEVRALDRRDPGRVDVVGDQDGSTDLPLGTEGAVGVGEDRDPGPEGGGGADAVHDRPRAVPLVEVGAARQDQHRDAVEVVAEQLAAVALGDRPPEVRDVGDLGAQVRVGPVGDGRRPAGAEHHEGVVRRSAALGDPAGRLARVVEGVRHRVRIARWRRPAQPGARAGRARCRGTPDRRRGRARPGRRRRGAPRSAGSRRRCWAVGRP